MPMHGPLISVDLTARELQVVDLLLAGLTNGQIAARLVVGRRTVEKHLESVYAKFGVHRRTQLVILLMNRTTGPNYASKDS